MKAALYPFMLLAAAGLVLSVGVHLAALAAVPIPGGAIVPGLTIGLFVVWVPSVLVGNRLIRGTNSKDFWKVMLLGCPQWMRRAFYGLTIYAMLNFRWFILATSKHKLPDGNTPLAVNRGISGHYMAFYSAAFLVLYSATHYPKSPPERRCANGHVVSGADELCPICGGTANNKSTSHEVQR